MIASRYGAPKIRPFFEKSAPTRNIDFHKDIVLYLEDISVSFDGFKE